MNVRYFGLLLLVLLPACASAPLSGPSYFNCMHWGIGVSAPRHMEAWVEELDVKDDRGLWVLMRRGVVGELGTTVGWDDGDWAANTISIQSAGAPMEVYIRWQSLAEPQTYTWHFIVPESVRQALTRREQVKPWYGPPETSCRNDIVIGVAPGGRTIVWNEGNGFPHLEVMRGQAEVELLGPGQGWGKGYAYPLSDEAKQYIEEHGIPYDSWAPSASTMVVTNADVLAHPSPEPATIDIAAHPEGAYVLSGMMEVDSRVVLKADGTFQGGIEVGGAYGIASGRWIKRGDTITLQRTSKNRPGGTGRGADDLSPLFDHMQLTIDGQCLRISLMGSSACYLRH